MNIDYTLPTNRMAKGRGRPANASPRPDAVEATPVVVPDYVPAMICPKCGRGQQPRVIRKHSDSRRDCRCALCGGEYEFTPATIRLK